MADADSNDPPVRARSSMTTAVQYKSRISIHDWELGEKIGSGSYSKVRIARNQKDPTQKVILYFYFILFYFIFFHLLVVLCVACNTHQAAVKIIDLEALSRRSDRPASELTKRALREIGIVKQLKHENIVELYDVALKDGQVYMVMELATGGDMFDYVKDSGGFSEGKARVYFRDIVSALEYCHAHLVIHRDLKLENLLLSADRQQVKLADFGLSNHLIPGKPLETFCGSSQYTAPEVMCGAGYIGPSSDVWSLGVVLYTFVTGCLPFGSCGEDYRSIIEKAAEQDFVLDSSLSRGE